MTQEEKEQIKREIKQPWWKNAALIITLATVVTIGWEGFIKPNLSMLFFTRIEAKEITAQVQSNKSDIKVLKKLMDRVERLVLVLESRYAVRPLSRAKNPEKP